MTSFKRSEHGYTDNTRPRVVIIKPKYFSSKRSWLFQGKAYQEHWILYDFYTTAFGVKKKYHLIKLSWIASHKHIKTIQNKSSRKLRVA